MCGPKPLAGERVECREIDANGSRVIALATELGLKESWRYIFNAGAERMQIRYPPNTDAWARGDTALPWELARREDGFLELRLGSHRHALAAGQWGTFATEAGIVLGTRAGENPLDVRAEPRLAPVVSGRLFSAARVAFTCCLEDHARRSSVVGRVITGRQKKSPSRWSVSRVFVDERSRHGPPDNTRSHRKLRSVP